MAAKKKARKQKKLKAKARKQTTLVKKSAAARKGRKGPAGSKSARKKNAAKGKARAKAVAKKARPASRKPTPGKRRAGNTVFAEAIPERRISGRQSGDLQGISPAEAADSESVGELLEEGNPFEAEVIAGVQDAENAEGREVRTHEVPEDDVPEEYLDEK